MREHVSGFDRFWNSTFGLPQQYLFRLLRVLQDDRVDLFSKRGLLDMSLIPVLGMFDSDRYDVGTKEKFDRTLGALGAKPSLAGQIGVEVFTDPLTFLTAGVTGAGKAAALAGKARNVGPMKRALAAGDELSETVGTFKQKLKDALAHKDGTILDAQQRKQLEASSRALDGVDESKGLHEFMKEAGKREIQIGLPILNGYGAVIHRNQAYSGWTRFLADKTKATGLTTSLVEATKGMVSGIPALNGALEGAGKSWRAFRDGVATTGENLRVFEPGAEFAGEGLRPMTNTGRAVYLAVDKRGASQVKSAYANAVAEQQRHGGGEAPWDALLDVFGKKDAAEAGGAAELWSEITGKAVTEAGMPTVENFNTQIDSFMDGYRKTVDAFKQGGYSDKVTAAGKLQEAAAETGKIKLFEAGRKLGEGWRKVFISDVGKKEFMDAERNFRSAAAYYQQAVEERVRFLAPMRAAAAKELGMSPQDFDARVMKLHEANAMQDELQDRLMAIQQNPQSAEAAQAMEDYAARYIQNLGNLRKMAQGGKANPFDTAILAAMEPVFKEGLRDGDTIQAVMEGLHQTVAKWAPELTGQMDSYGSYQLLTGGRRGRHLQFIPNDVLKREAKQLKEQLDAHDPTKPTRSAVTPENAALIKGLAERLGISEKKALSLAKKGGGTRVKGAAGKFYTLTAEDKAQLAQLKPQVHRPTLMASDLKRIQQVLEQRKLGKSKYVVTPKSTTVKFPHAARRMNSLGVERQAPGVDELLDELGLDEGQSEYLNTILGGDELNEMVDTGEAVTNSLALVVMAKELKRAAAAGTEIAPDLHRAATEVIQRNSELMEQAFYGAAGDAGKAYLTELEKVRREVHANSAEAGLLTAGSPVAYSPRVKGFKESQILDQMLDDAEFYQVIDTSQPRLGMLFRRHKSSIGVQDLNILSRALAEAEGPKAAKWKADLDKMARANGYKDGFAEYSEEALLNLMNRFAQGERVRTTADLVDNMMMKGEVEGSFLGGRVEQVIQEAGREVEYGRVTKFGRMENKGETASIPVRLEAQTTPEARGFIIRTAGGHVRPITAETLAMHRGSIMGLGQPDFKALRARALEHGGDYSSQGEAALAFAHKAARGQVDGASMMHTIDDALMNIKEGDYIAFGNRDVIANTLGTIQGQWRNFGAFWNGYDTVHHFIKRLQTVYRPAFLGANTASAFAQSTLAGASPAAAARGYWHAARFMSDNAQLASHYDRFAAASAHAEKGITGTMRSGTEFLRVLRRNPELKGVEWADEVAFRVGAQEFTFREMAPHMRPLLMSTGVREGLRGGSRVSQALTKLGEGEEILSKAGKVDEFLKVGAEEVEVYNRLTTFFALVDDGMSLDRAGVNSLAAHVNYADLTNIERTWFKRLFGFYTWTRKMTPFILKKFADDPSIPARLAGLLRSDAIEEDENGNFVVNADKFRVVADRFNPALDTLRLLEVVGESMQGVASPLGIRGAYRQERIQGMTRAPLSAGGLTGVMWDALKGDGTGAQQATENAVNTFWLSRVILGEVTGDTDRTITEQVFEQLVPVKSGNGRERANRVIRGRTEGVVGELERKAKATTDIDLKERLYAEIQRLREYAKSLEKPQ